MADVDHRLSKARRIPSLQSPFDSGSDSVGRRDRDDLYRFGLAASSNVSLELTRLSQGGRLKLELYGLKRSLRQVLRAIGGLDFRQIRAKDLRANLQKLPVTGQDLLQSGVYFVRVLQQKGSPRYRLQVGATAPDTEAPAAIAAAPNLFTGGSSPYDFTVTYSDNAGLAVSSFDDNDIRITGPNGFSQLATRVAVDLGSDGTPRTVTYRILPPGGSWEAADNGAYEIALEPNQIVDTSGNAAAAGSLGSFSVSIGTPPPPDTTAPTASLSVANVGNSVPSHQFTVTYSDNVGLDATSFDSSDIQVSGPNGFSQLASFVSATGNVVTYRIAAPGSKWDTGDNGTYTLSLRPNQVRDTSGNAATPGLLGSFQVSAPPRSLQFSGGSNGPYNITLNLDTSVEDSDSSASKGLFRNALKSMEVSTFDTPPKVFTFGGGTLKSFEADIPPIEFDGIFTMRRTLYQIVFPSKVNISRADNPLAEPFLVDTLTFMIGPLTADDNLVNSLSPLEDWSLTQRITVPGLFEEPGGGTVAGPFETNAYTLVLTNGTTINHDAILNPNGNWFVSVSLD